MQLTHVLLTTDLSDESLRAFPMAEELARKFGARITLLYLVPDLQVMPHGAPLAPPLGSPDAEEALKLGAESLEKVRQKHLAADLSVTCHAQVGTNLATAITGYAHKHKADWIVMSTHGRSGLRRFVLGSIAEEVLRHASCPVLCIPPPRER